MRFQSPEGDSLFFYAVLMWVLAVLLLTRFSPPKGIHCFSTFLNKAGDALVAAKVSVPRRGFIVFLQDYHVDARGTVVLFQSPEGDSLFFYEFYSCLFNFGPPEFQSPEGDSLFFYWLHQGWQGQQHQGFSPPKGIHCFSTRKPQKRTLRPQNVSVPRRGFIVFLQESD